jgi:hypothetical protein
MEVGPQAVPESRVGIAPYEETQIGSIITDLRKGNLLGVFWAFSASRFWALTWRRNFRT